MTRRSVVQIAGLMILAALLGIASRQFKQYVQASQINGYYEIIDDQETLDDSVRISDKELGEIYRCKDDEGKGKLSSDECLRRFYQEYALDNGVERAFAHLARLQKEHADLLPNCHYISHGIGHAALLLYGNQVQKAFSVLDSSPVYKNISSCGNGYFHGIIEELAKDTTGVEGLVNKLGGLCRRDDIVSRINCFHGIGHAALIQDRYDIPSMLRVCEGVASSTTELFDCTTGGFMEDISTSRDSVVMKDGTARFALCDSLEKKYQPACYLEQASALDMDLSTSYTDKIGRCRQIGDDVNRMACVKLFAIRAVRMSHFKDIREMCMNTSSIYERVACTAVVANKIAASIDYLRGDAYGRMTRDICDTLPDRYAPVCKEMIGTSRIFYTGPEDLSFSGLKSWKEPL